MAYLAPIHRPSSVRHAIKLSFLGPESDDLLIAKANRLEIYSPDPRDPSQLTLQHSKTLWGKVTLLQKLRPAKSDTDHVFIGTDRWHYFTLSWDRDAKELKTERSWHDVAEKSARDSQTGDRVHIDPSARFMALECFEGVVNILPIAHAGKGKRKAADHEIGELGDPIPVRISELFVKSSCFLHRRSPGGAKQPNPEMALLWEDTSEQRMRLKFRELEYTPSLRPQEEPGSAELEKGREASGEVEMGSSILIPLPAPMYGCLIIGETSISYVEEWEERKLLDQRPLEEATVWVAWCAIDEQRFVLADDYGKLYLLFIQQNADGEYSGHRIDQLGVTSRANVLVYLDGGRIFVGSHQGDSQVIQIEERGLQVVQTFPNIAPILDFTVMDMGNRSADAPVNEFSSGQARIVTGSGAFKDGSLRSVRSGVGLEDLGSIGEMGAPVTGLFSMRSGSGDLDDTLVVSFVGSSRVFRFSEDGDVEEVEHFRSFDLGDSTLYAGSLQDGRAVQVTSSAVVLSDADVGMALNTWKSGGASITAVAAENATLLLSLGGAALVVLNLQGDSISEQARREFDGSEQVSCIAACPVLPGTCVAGFWKDSKVSFLSLHDLQPTATEIVSQDDALAVPRSLAVARVLPNKPATLFVGLADGNVVTYSVTSPQQPFSARKSIVLGTQQANFSLLPRRSAEGDLQNVFATCEHPSLIYGSEGRIVYSAVTTSNASAICSFDSEPYPNAIAVVTEEGELKLAAVDEERRTHVQSLPVNSTVRRIAYSPDLKAFGLGTIERTLSAGEEKVDSFFRLVDEVAFQELHSYRLNEDELIECCVRCKLDDGSGDLAERFVVGTAYLDDASGEGDGTRGRIIVFEVTEGRQLKVVTELGLRGACRCLGVLEGVDGKEGGVRIVAALIKTVVIYSFDPSQPTLVKTAGYRTATAPIDLAITGSTIAVTDLMKSCSLIQYTPGEAGLPDKLIEIARHFDTLWGTAIAHVADNTFLQADAEGNLTVLEHDKSGFSEEDRRRLRVTSETLLGEMVNRIRPITISSPSPNAAVIPQAFLATVEGGVYMFGAIAADKQNLLIQLQQRVAEVLKVPGLVPFGAYRGVRTQVRDMSSEGPSRFVDGEILESFLGLEDGVQGEVCEGLAGVEEVRGMVEGLRRMC